MGCGEKYALRSLCVRSLRLPVAFAVTVAALLVALVTL